MTCFLFIYTCINHFRIKYPWYNFIFRVMIYYLCLFYTHSLKPPPLLLSLKHCDGRVFKLDFLPVIPEVVGSSPTWGHNHDSLYDTSTDWFQDALRLINPSCDNLFRNWAYVPCCKDANLFALGNLVFYCVLNVVGIMNLYGKCSCLSRWCNCVFFHAVWILFGDIWEINVFPLFFKM